VFGLAAAVLSKDASAANLPLYFLSFALPFNSFLNLINAEM
jgi:hypothetical protein